MKSKRNGGGWPWSKKPCNLIVDMKMIYDEVMRDINAETNDEKKLTLLDTARIEIEKYKLECVNTSDDDKIKDMLNGLNNEIMKFKNKNFDSYLNRQEEIRKNMRENKGKDGNINSDKSYGGKKRKQTKKRKRNKKSRNNKR